MEVNHYYNNYYVQHNLTIVSYNEFILSIAFEGLQV